jgi:hypothetical protein
MEYVFFLITSVGEVILALNYKFEKTLSSADLITTWILLAFHLGSVNTFIEEFEKNSRCQEKISQSYYVLYHILNKNDDLQ